MTSLKSLIPSLAPAVHATPAALYERQRALVRAGLLHSRPGRGPGSGVLATGQAVAMLLISIIATSSLSEVADQTRTLANLKGASGKCPLTGKKTFGAALTAVLGSESLVARVGWIECERRGQLVTANFSFREPGYFQKPEEERRTSSGSGQRVRHKTKREQPIQSAHSRYALSRACPH